MALVNRFSRLFTADFNALLDRIEEPEVLLKQAVRDMQHELDELKRRGAALDQAARQLERESAALARNERQIGEELDAAHRAGLGTAWQIDSALASVMAVFVGPTTDSSPSAPGENIATGTRDVPPYVLIQPTAQVRLPGDLALLVQGGIALSEGLTETPTRDYYYEMLGVPVSRYDFLVGLRYPWISPR